MAKKKSPKSLKTEITELSAAVEESQTCAACGTPMKADATTCPNCGTPTGEDAELHDRAEESLKDLENHLAQSVEVPPPEADPPRRANAGLESAAQVGVDVDAPLPAPAAAPSPSPVVESAPKVIPEPAPESEVEEGEELGGFIEEIEAEVGPGEPEPEAESRAAAARKPVVRAVHTTTTGSRSSRWVAPVAAGLVIYVLALFLLAILGRFVVASFMVVATFLVFAGMRARPGPPGAAVPGTPARAMEYVCPLCGTEIPPRASHCPTCGAMFEE